MLRARKLILTAVPFLGAATAFGQVPDMLTALDAGGRALGAGGALNTTSVSTLSATYNPAALAYVQRSQAGIGARSLESSRTVVTGAVNDLTLDSQTKATALKGSHIGFALPMKGGSRHTVLGVAWTVGGYFEDLQNGQGLDNGVQSYIDFTRAQTDFINIAFGTTNANQSFAWGAGLVLAQQNIRNFQRITFTDSNIPPQEVDTDTTGTGVGFQAGLMMTPPENPNLTLAITARTPIKVKHSGSPLGLYERIPGRIAAGLALRRDGFRSERDYLILGGEIQHFFGGKDSPRLDRVNQTTGHIGAEYNWARGDAMIPVRLGYAMVPAGGDGFRSRNGYTYGFGYRPNHGNWLIEVNFGKPEGGGRETSVFLTYRFGK